MPSASSDSCWWATIGAREPRTRLRPHGRSDRKGPLRVPLATARPRQRIGYRTIRRGRTGTSGTSASSGGGWLWEAWSPDWHLDDTTFETTARSFDNPHFVEVSIHSCRHRWGNAPGDRRYDEIEARIATLPRIPVSTTVVHGANDGATFPETSAAKERHFTGPYEREVIGGVGHFVQRERPDVVSAAVLAHLRPSLSS